MPRWSALRCGLGAGVSAEAALRGAAATKANKAAAAVMPDATMESVVIVLMLSDIVKFYVIELKSQYYTHTGFDSILLPNLLEGVVAARRLGASIMAEAVGS